MTSHFASFLNKTNIFHVVMDLYSNRSEKTSKCVKKINDTLGCASRATSLFLPRFDVMCYVLLNRSTATWSAFINIYCSTVQIWYRSPCLPLFFVFSKKKSSQLTLGLQEQRYSFHRSWNATRLGWTFSVTLLLGFSAHAPGESFYSLSELITV